MQEWLNLTPEFRITVEMITSPLTLLVALWGMTSERMLTMMRAGGEGSRSGVMMMIQQAAGGRGGA
jgi:hypothetical protein